MQRARRLASIAITAALGVTVLSACRSEPGVAAYIGDHKITEDEVTRVLDDARSKVPAEAGASNASPEPGLPPMLGPVRAPTRAQVVSVLVLGDVCRRLAADRGFQPEDQSSPEQVAERLGVPGNSEYAVRISEVYDCLAAVPVGQPVTPTEEELADIVARGRKAGVVSPQEKDSDAGQRLTQGGQLGSGLAQRNALTEAIAGYRVTVSPRYRPLEFPVLSFSDGSAAVSVVIGDEGAGTVVDGDRPRD